MKRLKNIFMFKLNGWYFVGKYFFFQHPQFMQILIITVSNIVFGYVNNKKFLFFLKKNPIFFLWQNFIYKCWSLYTSQNFSCWKLFPKKPSLNHINPLYFYKNFSKLIFRYFFICNQESPENEVINMRNLLSSLSSRWSRM